MASRKRQVLQKKAHEPRRRVVAASRAIGGARGSSVLRVRSCRRRDVAQIARLYFETVRRTNARDYGSAQIAAWAPRIYPPSWWLRRFKRRAVVVAEAADRIVGFAELRPGGEVDCFYVHHGWQGRGVGRALMARLQHSALHQGAADLSADVSITARPFFRRMGFRVLRVQKRFYRGRMFRQYKMAKRLHSPRPDTACESWPVRPSAVLGVRALHTLPRAVRLRP